MSLHSSVRDLRKAFDKFCVFLKTKKHSPSQIQNSNADKLILFYCIECGLKALYGDSAGLDKIRDDVYSSMRISNGHDLIEITKLLSRKGKNIKIDKLEKVKFYVKSSKVRKEIYIKQIHEAWRYGVNLQYDNNDEQLLVEWLLETMEEIQNFFNQP